MESTTNLPRRYSPILGLGICGVLLFLIVPASAENIDGTAGARRGPGRIGSPPATGAVLPVPAVLAARSSISYEIESGAVSFGEVTAESPSRLDQPVMIRVYSDRNWVLKLVPSSPNFQHATGTPVPVSRLRWRVKGMSRFVPFQWGQTVIVTQGRRTGSAGERVDIDLQLLLDEVDPTGAYDAGFSILLTAL